MNSREQVWIVQRLPGNSFTTYRGRDGESVRLPIGPDIIGPFDSIPEAADYLSKNSILHASYELISKWSPKEIS